MAVYDSWKGWGAKGLAFKRLGGVMTDTKRELPGAETLPLMFVVCHVNRGASVYLHRGSQ